VSQQNISVRQTSVLYILSYTADPLGDGAQLLWKTRTGLRKFLDLDEFPNDFSSFSGARHIGEKMT